MAKPKSAPARGRPREFDPERALDRAMHVFWRKGYLGTTMADLTGAMRINGPSLYAAFGNKEALLLKALERYHAGPAAYLQEALEAPSARQVAEKIFRGAVEVGTGAHTPPGCFWVHSALSSGDPADPLRRTLAAQRAAGVALLARRFARAVEEGDLAPDTHPADLARLVFTISTGLSVNAATGATRKELRRVVDTVMRGWSAGR